MPTSVDLVLLRKARRQMMWFHAMLARAQGETGLSRLEIREASRRAKLLEQQFRELDKQFRTGKTNE
jgi:hypothetical protein